MKIKHLTATQFNSMIKKLQLNKKDKDFFNHKIDYDFYIKEEEKDNKKIITTLENQMNHDLEHESKIYFLTKEIFNYNKMIANKNGFTRPSITTTTTQIELI